MGVLDGLHMLHADQLSDGAAAHDFAHSDEVGGVAQHVAHRHDAAVLVGLCEYGLAFLFRLCHRLFQQYVIAHREGLHTGLVVYVVGGRDDHRVGELGHLEHLAPVAETVLCVHSVLVRHLAASVLQDVGHADHLDGVGPGLGVAGIDVAAAAGADDHDADLSVHHRLERADGQGQVVERTARLD